MGRPGSKKYLSTVCDKKLNKNVNIWPMAKTEN